MEIGDVFLTTQFTKYTVEDFIGQGGQGSVFLVRNKEKGLKVLKWYHEDRSTKAQKKAIMDAIRIGAPDDEKERTFIWPQELVEEPNGKRFGYIMDYIDTSRFIEIRDMKEDPSKAPSVRMRCVISYNLVRAFMQLHLRGYSYRDISDGNFLFDPKTGAVAICDNDNVGVESESQSQVLGTLIYMAPEVVRREAKPGTYTDLYSLAVLLFEFWVWHHPLHGKQEYLAERTAEGKLTSKALVSLYGYNPIFIFNKQDNRNRIPIDVETKEPLPGYEHAMDMWQMLPARLKRAFRQVFTEGLSDPKARLDEFEWLGVFSSMLDNIILCPHDNAEVFALDKEIRCWHCGAELKHPRMLFIRNATRTYKISLSKNMRLYGYHIDEYHSRYRNLDIVGYLEHGDVKTNIWGLYNNTDSDWRYTSPGGTVSTVRVGQHAIVQRGATIVFNPQDPPTRYVLGKFGG